MRDKRGRKTGGLFALVGVAVFGLVGGWGVPRALIAPSEQIRADVILHLAIDPRSDADAYVARLYKQGMAEKILCVSSQVACNVYPADYAARHLIALGVPKEDVLTLHLPLQDCGAKNLPQVVEYVQQQGWRRALLVVSPVGSRPGRWMAQRYFGRAGLNVAITYSPQDRQDFLHRWWRTHTKAQRVVGVVMHTVLDWLYPQCW